MAISLPLARQLPTNALAGINPRAGILRLASLAGQLGILWLVLTAGSILSTSLALPLPGNLTGMLLLLGLLWSRVLPLEVGAGLTTLLVRHLILFFIPL